MVPSGNRGDGGVFIDSRETEKMDMAMNVGVVAARVEFGMIGIQVDGFIVWPISGQGY